MKYIILMTILSSHCKPSEVVNSGCTEFPRLNLAFAPINLPPNSGIDLYCECSTLSFCYQHQKSVTTLSFCYQHQKSVTTLSFCYQHQKSVTTLSFCYQHQKSVTTLSFCYQHQKSVTTLSFCYQHQKSGQ